MFRKYSLALLPFIAACSNQPSTDDATKAVLAEFDNCKYIAPVQIERVNGRVVNNNTETYEVLVKYNLAVTAPDMSEDLEEKTILQEDSQDAKVKIEELITQKASVEKSLATAKMEEFSAERDYGFLYDSMQYSKMNNKRLAVAEDRKIQAYSLVAALESDLDVIDSELSRQQNIAKGPNIDIPARALSKVKDNCYKIEKDFIETLASKAPDGFSTNFKGSAVATINFMKTEKGWLPSQVIKKLE